MKLVVNPDNHSWQGEYHADSLDQIGLLDRRFFGSSIPEIINENRHRVNEVILEKYPITTDSFDEYIASAGYCDWEEYQWVLFFRVIKMNIFDKNEPIPIRLQALIAGESCAKRGLIAYVKKLQAELTSFSVHHYSEMSYILNLYGAGDQFHLASDIYQNSFAGTRELFRMHRENIGDIDTLGNDKTLDHDTMLISLDVLLQLGEIVNRVTLMYNFNFEEHTIGFIFSQIIREIIEPLIVDLKKWSSLYPVIGPKIQSLEYLLGRVLLNYAHERKIDFQSIDSIFESLKSIYAIQDTGLQYQKSSQFGGDMREEESSNMIYIGNRAHIDLEAVEGISNIQGYISGAVEDMQQLALQDISKVYAYGSSLPAGSLDCQGVIQHFIKNHVEPNGYQIEALLYIVEFYTEISYSQFIELLKVLLKNSYRDYSCEEIRIKIVNTIIMRVGNHIDTKCVEDVHKYLRIILQSLKKSGGSHSLLGMSRLYLTLSNCFLMVLERVDEHVDIRYKSAIKDAMNCFIHYKNIRAEDNVSIQTLTLERQIFVKFGVHFSRDIFIDSRIVHPDDLCEKLGIKALELFRKEHERKISDSIENTITGLIVRDGSNDIAMQFELTNISEMISSELFYNMAEVTLNSNCADCYNESQDVINGFLMKRSIEKCEKCNVINGYCKRVIPLYYKYTLEFIYPEFIKPSFDILFERHANWLEVKIGSLVTIHLQKQQMIRLQRELATNITILEQKKQKDFENARRDSITGLPNFLRFQEDFTGFPEDTLFLLFKVNELRSINDWGGAENADAILSKLFNILVTTFNSHGNLYGIRPNEFCMVVPGFLENYVSIQEIFHKDAELSQLIAEEGVCMAFFHQLESFIRETPIHIRNTRVSITISGGITYGKGRFGRNGVQDIVRHLSAALNESVRNKTTGNCILYSPSLDIEGRQLRHMQQQAELDEIITRGLIYPHFQPIFSNTTGKVVKYECLMRLGNPQSGDEIKFVNTPEYIQLAESSGKYFELSTKHLEKIFAYMRKERCHFSVNISEGDLLHGNFVEMFKTHCREYAINPSRITIEVLEKVFSQGGNSCFIPLMQLREFGCKLSLDDFGTEGSNLNRISTLQPDEVKLDQFLIRDILTNPMHELMVRGIVRIIRSINERLGTNYITTAEFVSSQEIHAMLQEIGVDNSQGFYLGKPAPDILRVDD